MERNKQLEHELSSALKEYAATLNWEKNAYSLKASKESKSVIVTWPYPLMEVYFDFVENNEKIMSESIEFYENETQEEFRNYVIYILNRYFTLPTRLVTLGKILKRQELQVKSNNEWCSIYE